MHHIEIVSQLEDAHLKQLPELLRSATLVDGHEPLGEHKFLRLVHGDDLSRAILAYEGDQLLGYAHTVTFGLGEDRRLSCEFVVHPSQRRRGIGRLLLSSAVMHANANGVRRMDLWSYNDSDLTAGIAAHFGFLPVRRLLHLHRHMLGPVAPALSPPGLLLRAFDPVRDAATWLALNARAFASHQEQGHWTAADLQARIEQSWFNPRDFLLAEAGNQIVGFNWLKIEERPGEGMVGEVYVLGVDPAWQGRKLGAFLIAAGIKHMAARGVDVAAVYVDDSNAAAVALYGSMGFHHHHVDVCYSRPLGNEQGLTTDTAA